MNSLEILILPDHLLYRLVCAWPGTERLTELDKLLLAAVLVYAEDRMIDLTAEQRLKIRDGLHLSHQGLTNAMNKLTGKGMLVKVNGGYMVPSNLIPLLEAPKQMDSQFTLNYVTNKLSI